MKILVIADRETCLAFALAGIAGRPVESETEVPSILENVCRERPALILVSEALAERNREAVERCIFEVGGPLILEIPSTSGPLLSRGQAAERILSLLKR
jgi:vacuolar-type H+-ATPase subunit F/Vma7